MQSGSDRILDLMNRTYTADHYLRLVEKIRQSDPRGEPDHRYHLRFPDRDAGRPPETMELMREVRYDGAYTFKYSARANTRAWEMSETSPEEEKGRRVQEIDGTPARDLPGAEPAAHRHGRSGPRRGPSRKSPADGTGRTDTNKKVVFPQQRRAGGIYIDCRIEQANSATLFGRYRTN